MNFHQLEPLEARIAPAAQVVSVANASAPEGDDATGATAHVNFTVKIAAAVDHDVTVIYSTADGTAIGSATTGGMDYTSVSHGSAVITAGQTSVVVPISILGDTTNEPSETFKLTVETADGEAPAAGSTPTGTGTILNDDLPTTLTVKAGNGTLTEGTGGTSTLLFSALPSTAIPTGYHLQLIYQTVDGTAVGASDFTSVTNGSATVASGQKIGYLPVTITGDSLAEPPETFQVKITGATLVNDTTGESGTVAITTASGTATILDNDPHNILAGVKPVAATVTEGHGAQTAAFTATLTTALTHEVTVTYSFTETYTHGTGTPSPASGTGTVKIPAGQLSANFDVPYTGSDAVGPDQIISVNLTGATAANLETGFSVAVDPVASHHQASLRVLDSDATLTVAAPADRFEGNSGGTDFAFPVHLSAAVDHDVVISYQTVDGTAISTGTHPDFLAQPAGTITIKAGEQNAVIHVTALGDTLASLDEAFSLHLSGVTGATLPTAADTVAKIKNDDGAALVSIADATGSEGGNASFVIRLDHAYESDVTVTYKVSPGTAAATRYTATAAQTDGSATITIPAGQTQATVAIPLKTDANIDPQASFSVALQSTTAAALDPVHQTATGTILPANLLTLSIASATVAEGGASDHPTEYFRVTLSKAAPQDIPFTFTTVDGTAVGGTDFDAQTAHAYVIPKDATFFDVPVTLHAGNNVSAADRTFGVKIALTGDATTNLAALGQATAIGTIANDDAVFTITPTVQVSEGAMPGFASFTVTRATTGTVSVPGSVHYSTVPGTASANDFLATSGTLTFAANETTKTIQVPILSDTRYEGDESFQVVLSAPVNAVLGAVSAGTATITNDDPLPIIHINNPSIKEGNAGETNLVFTLSLDRVSEKVLNPAAALADQNVATVMVTADGLSAAQGTFASQVVRFVPGGPLQQTVTVKLLGNTTQNEALSTFQLKLSDPQGATADAAGTGTIIDDDPAPVVSVSSATATRGQAEVFHVSLSNPSAHDLKVFYYTQDGTATSTVAAPDYTGVPAKTPAFITIPAGQTGKDITIQTGATGLAGPDETFQLRLSSAVDASTTATPLPVKLNPRASVATGTLVSSAEELISINDVSVTEGNSGLATANFTVSLSAASTVPVTVHYTTADGTATVAERDYLAKAGTVVIPAGQTQAQVSVPVRGDLLQEGAETFQVVLSGAGNGEIGRATGTGTILNDDSTPTLNIADVSVVETAGGYLEFKPVLTSAAVSDVTFRLVTAPSPDVSHSATPNVDYLPASATFTIKAGQTTPDGGATLKVQVLDDTVFEGAENIAVRVADLQSASPVLSGHTTATGTILDNDVLVFGKTAKWIDVDGDLVTLTVSKGTLSTGDFDFTAANAIGGRTLTAFNIFNGGQQFLFADVTITAAAQAGLPAALVHRTPGLQGDGFVNVGTIQSNDGNFSNPLELQGFDLGNVRVDGNLDQILAGDLFNDVGLKLLQVRSFGAGLVVSGRTSAVTEGIGTLSVRNDFTGTLEVVGQQFGYIHNLTIGGALRGTAEENTGAIICTGAINTATLGSIVGGSGSGTGYISASAVGTLHVLGDIDNTGGAGKTTSNGSVFYSATVTAGSIGTARVDGSIIGGSLRAQNTIGSVLVAGDVKSAPSALGVTNAAVISAGGLTTALALRSVVIHGQVNGAKLLAGFQNNGDALSGDAQIGTVQIDGNVRALDIAAGILPGTDGVYGSPDDQAISAGTQTVNATGVISKIARVILGGTVTTGAGDTTHGIVANEIDTVIYQGQTLPLTGAKDTLSVGTGTNLFVRET